MRDELFPIVLPDRDLKHLIETEQREVIPYTRQIFTLEADSMQSRYVFPLHFDSVVTINPKTKKTLVDFLADIVVYGDTFFDPNLLLAELNRGKARSFISQQFSFEEKHYSGLEWVEKLSIRKVLKAPLKADPNLCFRVVVPYKPKVDPEIFETNQRVTTAIVKALTEGAKNPDPLFDEKEIDVFLGADSVSPYSNPPWGSTPEQESPYTRSTITVEMEGAQGGTYESKLLSALSHSIPLESVGDRFSAVLDHSVALARETFKQLGGQRGYPESAIRENSWAFQSPITEG